MQNTKSLRLRLPYLRKMLSVSLAVRLAIVTVMPAQTTLAADEQSDPPSTQAVLTVSQAPEQWLTLPGNSAYSVQVAPSRTEEAQIAAQKAAIAKRAVTARDTTTSSTPATDAISRDAVSALIDQYAAKYSVSADVMHGIVKCESGYNSNAKNRSSSAAGLAQFLTSTWQSAMTRLGYSPTISQYDGDKSIEALAYTLKTQGTTPWNASKSCWSR